MPFCYKNQHTCSAMDPMWSIYKLADRYLRNSGYLVKCEILLTFRCQALSERDFEKSKNTKDFSNLT